ncbi:conserved hypothetical protein [Aspergillus terreus NIH2624]|uniref:2-(3-amino-3-carboxypropyl)histidine synthase n=1 Tax=Aspergillus terreus (strain NIH 2624 / FGSC A1156) TaxID=341663 RepID=Q0CRG3_ASPTN|nr:uncharacterized protein ATEG_03721 [Aspergillus terreus NIH2624]EAU35523.1 conserved hypothetical protein [Aspergillus terreus NIH2624]
MLPDAPRVFQMLSRGLDKRDAEDNSSHPATKESSAPTASDDLTQSVSQLNVEDSTEPASKLYILADTSYGTCCVDEVAAEHVNADVVVHYGRSCLSPTARLPVIYVFTNKPLSLDPVVRAFKETYPDPASKVILAADVTYCGHLPALHKRLSEEGYTNLFATEVVHNPSSAIPNRTVPDSVREAPESLSDWQLFHISDPPTAPPLDPCFPRRRHPHLSHGRPDKRQRQAAASILGDCSASSLCHSHVPHHRPHLRYPGEHPEREELPAHRGPCEGEDCRGWQKELSSDAERVWTGAWQSDFQSVLDQQQAAAAQGAEAEKNATADGEDDEESEPESAPPEFDLRTGRYVSHSRPMRNAAPRVSAGDAAASAANGPSAARALARRAKGDLAMIGGTVSPGAEFLRSQRTWKGLGSDFDIQYEDEGEERDSTLVVEGRKGVARGYTVGESIDRH